MKKTIYKAGQFLDVRHVDASTRNEALAWLLETDRGPVAVRQIAGLVARRIVAVGEGRFRARPRAAFRHDPVRLAHGGLPAGRLHAACQAGRSRRGRRHPHCPLASNLVPP